MAGPFWCAGRPSTDTIRFELRGQLARAALVAAVGRMPTDGAMAEVAFARAALDQADATRS
jgi:hypothetical protein